MCFFHCRQVDRISIGFGSSPDGSISQIHCYGSPIGERKINWRAECYGNGHARFGEGGLEKRYGMYAARRPSTLPEIRNEVTSETLS